jgi:hypothetical protein
MSTSVPGTGHEADGSKRPRPASPSESNAQYFIDSRCAGKEPPTPGAARYWAHLKNLKAKNMPKLKEVGARMLVGWAQKGKGDLNLC